MAMRWTSRGILGKTGLATGIGFGVIDGVWTYKTHREEHPEASKAQSLLVAGATAAAWQFIPGVMWATIGYEVAKSLGEAGFFNKESLANRRRSMMMQGASWRYFDTETNATMRQRGLAAMQQTNRHLTSALGNEARSFHNGAIY